MKKNYKLGFIGGGFMAQSIIDGITSLNVVKKKNIIVSDVNNEIVEKLNGMNIKATSDNNEVINFSDIVIFAVKPQSLESVANSLIEKPKKVITIMAGVTKKRIKNYFGADTKVTRVMPNTPCSIGSGVMAIDASDFSEEDKNFTLEVFNALGDIVLLEESKMNAVTGISGSGPAYVYLFIKSLIDAGINQGLSEDESKALAVGTVLGGAEMVVANSEKDINELIKAVCSKGGTTIEAMNKFNELGFENIVNEAVAACVKRAEELSNQF